MTNFLNLRSGVGPDEDNLDDDVRATRSALSELSFAPAQGAGSAPVQQVRDFQADTGIRVDGVLKPGGETEQKVNNQMSHKRDRDRRTLDGMLGDADIDHPVGAAGTGPRNRRQDLVKSRDALDKVGSAPDTPPDAPKTRLANAVALGLRRFQRNEDLKPDGIMVPGGPTQAALRDKLAENGLAAPPPELDRRPAATFQQRDGRPEKSRARQATAASTENNVAKDIAALTLFERDGILQAAGLDYEPDPMGRLGQGRWLDADGAAVSGTEIKAILTEAVRRRQRLGGDAGANADALRASLMREAGFRYDAGRGLWTNADGETLSQTEAETALEAARRQAEAVLQGRASLDELRAGVAPAIAAPLAMAGGVLVVVAAAVALKLTLDALERRRRQQGRTQRSAPPPQTGRQALPEKDRKPTQLPGPDPTNPPKVPDRHQGPPPIPLEVQQLPGFTPEAIGDFIEIFPDDRDRLPQFFIVENRRGSEATQSFNGTIAKLLHGSADRTGVRITHRAGGREKRGIDKKERLLIGKDKPRDGTIRGGSFPDLWFVIQGSSRRLLINTVDTRKSGRLTGREARGAERLFENAETGDLILTIPKPSPGEEIDERLAADYLDDLLRRLNRPGSQKGREHFKPTKSK